MIIACDDRLKHGLMQCQLRPPVQISERHSQQGLGARRLAIGVRPTIRKYASGVSVAFVSPLYRTSARGRLRSPAGARGGSAHAASIKGWSVGSIICATSDDCTDAWRSCAGLEVAGRDSVPRARAGHRLALNDLEPIVVADYAGASACTARRSGSGWLSARSG
jgi:hypothetical protein